MGLWLTAWIKLSAVELRMCPNLHKHDPIVVYNLKERPVIPSDVYASPVWLGGFYRMVVEQGVKWLTVKKAHSFRKFSLDLAWQFGETLGKPIMISNPHRQDFR